MKKIYLFFLMFFFYFHCISQTVIYDKSDYQTIYLTDHKILFKIPSKWFIYFSSLKYFHLFARDSENVFGPRIEYRGLRNTTNNLAEREQYAKGWYQAIQISYPKWQYTRKKSYETKYRNQPLFTFEFEGTFQDGELIYKKIGFLRFFDDRIHAIYYTAQEKKFDKYLNTFQIIDYFQF